MVCFGNGKVPSQLLEDEEGDHGMLAVVVSVVVGIAEPFAETQEMQALGYGKSQKCMVSSDKNHLRSM